MIPRILGPYRVTHESDGIGAAVDVGAGDGYVIPGLTFEAGDVIYNAWFSVAEMIAVASGIAEVQVYYGRDDVSDNLLGGTSSASAYAQGQTVFVPPVASTNLSNHPVGTAISAMVAGGSGPSVPRVVVTAGEPVIVTIASDSGVGGAAVTAGEIDVYFLVGLAATAEDTAGELYPDYVDAAALKRYLRIPSADEVDDVDLALAASAASRSIDTGTNRQFGRVLEPVTLQFTAERDVNSRRFEVPIFDLMSTSGLVVAIDADDDGVTETTLAAEDYRLSPVNNAAEGRPWTRLVLARGISVPTTEYAVHVTARFGWTAVPSTIKKATLLQASRLFKRRDAPFGVAGSPETGSEMRLLAKLDPDVELMAKSYYRWWAAV